uniref:C2 domain-containing protein n=1 Tax=Xiphophorus couchianus TaxID=32473 RepID=A0A3B5M383_9TELE
MKPGIINYSLVPLYQLVTEPAKKTGVKEASERQNGVKKICSNKCFQGSTPSSYDLCAPPVTSLQRRLAHLTDTVKSASGLWGDVFTKTDSFMKVFLGNQTFQTSVISDDDSPQWNEEKFEVWDEDYHFLDRQNDLLGSCATTVQAGSVTSVCEMNHGLHFHYAAFTAFNL